MSHISSTRESLRDRRHWIKLVLFSLIVAASVLPARADMRLESEFALSPKAKHSLLFVPRAMQRTALNMVTFRNRNLAIQQWIDIAATFADAETTRESINRGSTEFNPFLGRRPGGPRTYIT